MEKKNTLLAFFKPLKSSKPQDDEKDGKKKEEASKNNSAQSEKSSKKSKADSVEKDCGDAIIVKERKSGRNAATVSNVATKELINEGLVDLEDDGDSKDDYTNENSRKRKAHDDKDSNESRKKLKQDIPSTPSTPSIQNFFKRIPTRTPENVKKSEDTKLNIDEKTTSKPDSEIVSKSQSDDTKINEVIDKDSLDTDSKKDSIEVVTNVKKDSIEVVTIDDDVVDKKTKQKKKNIVGKKSSKPNEATHKDKGNTEQENSDGKISTNLFSKKGKKYKEENDDIESDVSLEFDEEVVEEEKTNASVQGQTSIKNIFALMMQKGQAVPTKEHSDSTKEIIDKTDDNEQGEEIMEKNGVKKEECNDANDVAENKDELEKEVTSELSTINGQATPQVKDSTLMKMLSALSAVKNDIDDSVDEEQLDFTPRIRKKKKKASMQALANSTKINSALKRVDENTVTPKRLQTTNRKSIHFENEDKENNEKVELNDVYTVSCKGVEATLYINKFISGGQGECILHNGKYLTPNQFESMTGCKSKKYKVSLKINNKPMEKLLQLHGLDKNPAVTRRGGTPLSARNSGDSNSGRSTPISSGRSTPSFLPQENLDQAKGVKKSSKKTKLRIESESEVNDEDSNVENVDLVKVNESSKKKKLRIESEVMEVKPAEDGTEIIEEPPPEETSFQNSRRSGRIARNQDRVHEKQKEQEKIENEIKKIEQQEDEWKKKGRLVFPDQIKIPPKLNKKNVQNKKKEVETVDIASESESETDSDIEEITSDQEAKSSRKPAHKKDQGKLASIFMPKKKKIVEDPEKVAARRAFLLSSAPEECRSQLLQSNSECDDRDYVDVQFPKISHVRQEDTHPYWNIILDNLPFKLSSSHSTFEARVGQFSGEFFTQSEDMNIEENQVQKLNPSHIRSCVSSLKSKLKFPVNKMFTYLLQAKLLSDSKEFPTNKDCKDEMKKPPKKRKRVSMDECMGIQYRTDLVSSQPWTYKYRPRKAEHMIINKSETLRLKDWLSSWTLRRGDRSSQSSSYTSDSEFDECSEMVGTCALLTGPPGNGKSAAVYGLADQLGLKVIEVNASSCRTGKQVTSLLLEATQSQQVTGANTSQPKLNFSKAGPTVASTKAATDKCKKALILFEDVDVVFEDLDTGFYAAVSKICSGTKRPIIFTSSDSSALQIVNKNIKSRFQHFRFTESIEPSLLSLHLHLITLCEGFNITLTSIQAMVASRSSVRQSILDLQYLASSRHLQEVCEDDNDSIGRKKKSTSKLVKTDSCSEDDSDSSYSKYLDNAKFVKSRGSHRNVEYSLVESNPRLKLNHQSLMSQLEQHYQFQGLQRKSVFPLDSEEDVKFVPGMKPLLASRNILKNSEIFDMEGDGDFQDDDTIRQECDQKEEKIIKVSKENKKNIGALSKYLDYSCTVDLIHANTVVATDHIQDICDTLNEMSSSTSLSKLSIDQDIVIPAQQSDNFPAKTGCSEEEDDILSSVMCTQMLPDRSIMDTLAGTRNILRSEECRKVICREGKRGGRFYHYLAKYGFNPNVNSVTKVCNTFC